jgi:hypothetical protein
VAVLDCILCNTYVCHNICTFLIYFFKTAVPNWNDISSLFCIKGTTYKISGLQEKKECGTILRVHMTNTSRCKISPLHFGYSCRWGCHLFAYHREPLVEWFARHNSFYLKLAFDQFLYNRGDILVFLHHWSVTYLLTSIDLKLINAKNKMKNS